jgi:hypothetical protein
MSKMDALRAMREARYEQAQARARKAAGAAPRPAARTAPKPAAGAKAPAAPEPPEPAEELCGHRNMSGRTCTRERGHAAKSHRYS